MLLVPLALLAHATSAATALIAPWPVPLLFKIESAISIFTIFKLCANHQFYFLSKNFLKQNCKREFVKNSYYTNVKHVQPLMT